MNCANSGAPGVSSDQDGMATSAPTFEVLNICADYTAKGLDAMLALERRQRRVQSLAEIMAD